MDLKSFIISSVDPNKYYAARFSNWNSQFRSNVICPFHDDKSPSLALALDNGGARCHASSCQKSFGNIVHFESELSGVSEDQAAKNLYIEFVRNIIPNRVVSKFQAQLLLNKSLLQQVQKDMGLKERWVKKFRLGWHPDVRRLTIPIFNQFGHCVNIRMYKLPSHRRAQKDRELKIYSYKEKYGSIELFPWPATKDFVLDQPVFFMASEKEAMLARTLGLQAVCSTNGEGSFHESWLSFLAGYDVFIVMDTDEGGKKAALRLSEKIAMAAKSVRIINLPVTAPNKDFADYILKERGSITKLLKDQSKTSSEVLLGPGDLSPQSLSANYPKVPPYYDESQDFTVADIARNPALLNRRVSLPAIVSAKASRTYTIPWSFRIKVSKKPEFAVEVPAGRELLRFVKCHDAVIVDLMRKTIGNDNCRVTFDKFVTVTEVEIIPVANVNSDAPYAVQRCFFFGDKIEANVPCRMEIIPTTEIKSQETVGIIVKAEPIAHAVDQFVITPERIADLTIAFQPDTGEKVFDKLASIANYLSEHCTHVYNRLDWHIIAFLTWCSPLQFRLPNENEIQRGWLNTLALGDTETGKSKVVQSLCKLFNAGSFVNAENCTYVGLVGGAVKMSSGQFMLRWGRIPLADRQLVVVEELSGLSVQEISHMSDVRSSGIARLDKAGLSAETHARTRLIALSNVRPIRRTLASYLRGVTAVQELIGHSEDIARFDLITTLVDGEVSVETINQIRENNQPESYIAEDQWRSLISFIWALRAEHIFFTSAAHSKLLSLTRKLSEIYHPAIPLFKGGSGRYKLARIATAIACSQFNWDGRLIVVEPAHIAAAYKLLRMLYDKPSMGYKQFSEQMYDREQVKNTVELDLMWKNKVGRRVRSDVAETLIHAAQFTRDELCAIAGITIYNADQLLGAMVRQRVIRKGDKNIWEITPPGKKWLEKWISRK